MLQHFLFMLLSMSKSSERCCHVCCLQPGKGIHSRVDDSWLDQQFLLMKGTVVYIPLAKDISFHNSNRSSIWVLNILSVWLVQIVRQTHCTWVNETRSHAELLSVFLFFSFESPASCHGSRAPRPHTTFSFTVSRLQLFKECKLFLFLNYLYQHKASRMTNLQIDESRLQKRQAVERCTELTA